MLGQEQAIAYARAVDRTIGRSRAVDRAIGRAIGRSGAFSIERLIRQSRVQPLDQLLEHLQKRMLRLYDCSVDVKCAYRLSTNRI